MDFFASTRGVRDCAGELAPRMACQQPSHRAAHSCPRPFAPSVPSARPAFSPGSALRRGTKQRAATVEAETAVELSKIVHWNQNKRLQTQVAPVAENTITIRSLDWDRDRFDIEFGLDKGTTYNSYLIFGEKSTALVDASHEKFRDLYLDTLKKQLSKAGRSIDYLFVSHTEPDHSGLIPDVLDMFPEVTVCGSKVALTYLQGLTHRPFQQKVVKGGDTIDLGGGHKVEFVMAPNLHWPDTMFSFDHASGVMFTCDAFGAHYCAEEAFDTELETLSPHYRFYYDCLMKPNARSVVSALKKVKDLEYTTIANGHGPLLRFNLQELVERYRSWSEAVGKAAATVTVLYSSEYGFGDRLSQTLARGITKAGVATEMIDALTVDPQELVEVLGKSQGVVIMTPPRDSKAAQATLSTLVSALTQKHKVLVAESYGGQDEPVDTLVGTCLNASADTSMQPLRIRDTPTESTYQEYEEAGTDLAQLLTQKESIARKKAAMPPNVSKALARLASGLYVVTAATQGAKGAMVASWVAQASFEPLGITVAVAKDRAIESLLQVGDTFVLNCLGESNAARLMKHFLQRFPPGADRFAGVDTFQTPDSAAPVLADAIAFCQCRVRTRLETADHWITYAEVIAGDVGQPDGKTAVHRRKVANYY